MPINRQDATEVEHYIARFFAAPPSGRAQALRRLFVEKLDFSSATGAVSLANAPKNVALPPSAERIASMEGLQVVYVPLSGTGPDRVRKAEAAAAAKLVVDALQGDLLLVMTNPSSSQLHVIYPTFSTVAPSLRRMIIERDLPRRTAVAVGVGVALPPPQAAPIRAIDVQKTFWKIGPYRRTGKGRRIPEHYLTIYGRNRDAASPANPAHLVRLNNLNMTPPIS